MNGDERRAGPASAGVPLLERLDRGVLTLTLNRPDRLNALSPELYDALVAALDRAAVDHDVGALVLTGAGRAFCAGGDVRRMADGGADALSFEQRVERLRRRTRLVELLHNMDKPSIGMLRGAAVGAGLSIALACDLRYGDDSVRMRTGFLQIASSGDFGGHWLLPRIVGPAKARELYLTSPLLDATRCRELGLLNRLCAPAELEPAVMEVARGWAEGPRTALVYLKRNLEIGTRGTLAEVLDAESWRHVRCTDTADHREAVRAYVEKRPPRFGTEVPS